MLRFLTFSFLVGCIPTTFAFSPSVHVLVVKPDNCRVEVVTQTPPDTQEIGTLQLYNGPEPRTLAAFKHAVAKQVCEVGGDAAIAIVDDQGRFTKGTVLRSTSSNAPQFARAGAPAPAAPIMQVTDNELPKSR
jgi:hypothetical protein